MKFPIKKDDILKAVKPKEKKQFEENYNAHMGFVAGVENKDIVSILAEGYKSNKQLAAEGKTVSKRDAGKKGYQYVYLRFVLRKSAKGGETAEITDIRSMYQSLFSTKSSTGAWIFVPKRNIMDYEVRHVKSFDANGTIIAPKMEDLATVYSFKPDNMKRNEIAFDFLPPQDIQYFATTQEGSNPEELNRLGEHVHSYKTKRGETPITVHVYKHRFYEEKPLPDGADFE